MTCAWPPFSDAWEITVVRPVAYLSLSDYDIDLELKRRLSDHHRGVFVVGKPGSEKPLSPKLLQHISMKKLGRWSKPWKP